MNFGDKLKQRRIQRMEEQEKQEKEQALTHSYQELKQRTVAQLREIASGIEHEAVKGYTQLNKEHLLEALCKALNLDMHEHHVVVGIEKTAIKAKIKEFKKKRDEALAAHNLVEHKAILHRIHTYKRKLRKAMV
jgi:DNA-binding IclR family transcriptional regulator